MALTIITNPVGAGSSKVFAGLQPIEFIFKREDLAITSVTAGTGGAKINHAGDLTTYLTAGDSIYLYSVGTNYTYDFVTTIKTIVAGEITVEAPYIVSGAGGYINYFKNYYVELQCIKPSLSDVNLLPFSFQSDGDSKGNIKIDVSIINDLNTQRGVIADGLIEESKQEFEVKYKQVYFGSAENYTLINNKLLIVLYSILVPNDEEILNYFDLPKLYLGYPAAIVISNIADAASSTKTLSYNELDINNNIIASGSLSTLDSDVNGFLLWKWGQNINVNNATKYVYFNIIGEETYDFRTTDFAYPDFLTQ